MAEGFFRQLLGNRKDIEVASAGVHAARGQPPSVHAVEVCEQYGVNIRELRSQPLTAALVDDRPVRGAAQDCAQFERHGPVLVGAAVVVPLDHPGAGLGRAALDVEHQRAVVGAELVGARGAPISFAALSLPGRDVGLSGAAAHSAHRPR